MANYGSLIGRAAAVLTTGEVAGATLDLSQSFDNSFSVELDFTLGSLTNVIVRFYGSADNMTYRALSNGTALLTETITATATRYYMTRPSGVRYVYVSVQGTGTVTSSSCTYTYRYQLPLVQTKQDGAPHLG
jgi:hypothetical protein